MLTRKFYVNLMNREIFHYQLLILFSATLFVTYFILLNIFMAFKFLILNFKCKTVKF